jgi:hypothetical protein
MTTRPKESKVNSKSLIHSILILNLKNWNVLNIKINFVKLSKLFPQSDDIDFMRKINKLAIIAADV